MEYIIRAFQKQGLCLHHGAIKDYYPGSCEQCHMTNCGQKSIIYGLTPELVLIICDKCYEKKEPFIKSTIDQLQKITFYDKIQKNRKYDILNERGTIDSEWMIHPKYLFYIPLDNTVYFPLVKNENAAKEKWVSLRHFMILNDFVI